MRKFLKINHEKKEVDLTPVAARVTCDARQAMSPERFEFMRSATVEQPEGEWIRQNYPDIFEQCKELNAQGYEVSFNPGACDKVWLAYQKGGDMNAGLEIRLL